MPSTHAACPTQLSFIRGQLSAVPGEAAARLRVRVYRVAGDPEGVYHRGYCPTPGVRARLVSLRGIEQRPWCRTCLRWGTHTEVVGQNPDLDLSYWAETLARGVAEARGVEAAFAKTRGSNLKRRGELLQRGGENLEFLRRRMQSSNWRTVPGQEEILSHLESLLSTRRTERVPVSKTIRTALMKASAAAQGVSEWRGSLECDEVLIAVPARPQEGLGAQVVALYGLQRSGAGAVVAGPRFLAPLLVGQGQFPQITPAPEQAVSELAAGLWDPHSPGLDSIAHAVSAARDVLAT